jgi:hypothetical protein
MNEMKYMLIFFFAPIWLFCHVLQQKLCCQSEHTYVYSQSMLFSLSNSSNNSTIPSSISAKNIRRLIQELEAEALEK